MRRRESLVRRRSWALVLVALTAFLAGLASGHLDAVREPCRPRAGAPRPELPHPRSLNP